jgi:predicted AAA+ superfamily ATPase
MQEDCHMLNRDDVNLLMSEMKSLNENIKRLADAVAPNVDPQVFDRFNAFKVHSVNGVSCIKGIACPDPVRMRELKSIDDILGKLKKNTGQFLSGLPCNNALLYGPRGTGKSSAVKALLNEYTKKGLRMIEMERDALMHLFDIANLIRMRPEKFIIFCDDLTFEEEESSYRQLKAVLEGGLETKPGNMIIYATSNRRHLMPEKIADNVPVYKGGELHPAETLEEKLSLSDRFGLRLGFFNFDKDDYLRIVHNYASLRKLGIEQNRLEREAMQWSLEHGSYSGRTARQFVDDLEGRITIKKNQCAR